ncbi:hypothetical protein WG66_004654 [Moniliophthora roreri]|nr:hypothetical protein WG66_004654 [Moniliophthora roreri]
MRCIISPSQLHPFTSQKLPPFLMLQKDNAAVYTYNAKDLDSQSPVDENGGTSSPCVQHGIPASSDSPKELESSYDLILLLMEQQLAGRKAECGARKLLQVGV